MTPVSESDYGGDDDKSSSSLPTLCQPPQLPFPRSLPTPKNTTMDNHLCGIQAAVNQRGFGLVWGFFVLLFVLIGTEPFFFVDMSLPVNPTTNLQNSITQNHTTPISVCGPAKPYQPFHLLPVYNQTPYGILD